MKVYRGFDKEIGPISYAHWTYVTPDIEQAKYYATKDGEVEDGAIIEYDLDLDHLRFISLDKLNSFAQSKSEIYSEKDLLWYQEGLGESLYKYISGIYFTDPYYKDHTIYIVFRKDDLKNGRILTPEEFDAIQLKESVYENKNNTSNLITLYRGFNTKYGNFGSPTSFIWATDDIDIAKMYADKSNSETALLQFQIDPNKLEIISSLNDDWYDFCNEYGIEEDGIDFDEECADWCRKNGYNCFIHGSNEEYWIILDTNLIMNPTIIK